MVTFPSINGNIPLNSKIVTNATIFLTNYLNINDSFMFPFKIFIEDKTVIIYINNFLSLHCKDNTVNILIYVI